MSQSIPIEQVSQTNTVNQRELIGLMLLIFGIILISVSAGFLWSFWAGALVFGAALAGLGILFGVNN